MILQKVLTGSSLVSNGNDKDYLIFFNGEETSKEEIYSLKEPNEDFLLRDITKEEEWDKANFFNIMTYLIYEKKEMEIPVIEINCLKNNYDKFISNFSYIGKKAFNSIAFSFNSKYTWWFIFAKEYIETGDFNIDVEVINDSKNETIPIEVQDELILFFESKFVRV